jgi:hypothetical protein
MTVSQKKESAMADGLRGRDKQQSYLRDPNGGTNGTPRGDGEQNEALTTMPAGLGHREGPLNKTTGRKEKTDD